jgi:biopolymer transport protein ExbD
MVDSPGSGNAGHYGQDPTDFTSNASNLSTPVPRTGKPKLGISRAKAAREMRRAAQFAKFRNIELNLVPLVDTFVSIVFFALTTATVGEMAPIVTGVNLPSSRIGANAMQQLTIGVSSGDLTVGGERVMATAAAARAQSNNPAQPLLIPQLHTVLAQKADSIRTAGNIGREDAVPTVLAIQGDRSMRYDLLSRVLQTARLAGFRNISLQVMREAGATGTVAATVPAP